MINMDQGVVKVVPSSPPPCRLGAESPEIRVTDTPEPGSHHLMGHNSPPPTPTSSRSSGSPVHTTPPPTMYPPPTTTPCTTSSPLSSPPFMTPSLAMFQPFLMPHQAAAAAAAMQHQLAQQQLNNLQRVLPFSIENILKPNFGPGLSPFMTAAAAASPVALSTPSPPTAQLHPAAASTTSSSTKTTKKTKSVKETSSSPVDLTSAVPPKVEPSENITEKKESTKDDPEKGDKKDDKEDLPPGMVRGPNGQLWPAWVFCTRYSDRPSSGPRARKIKKPKEAAGSSPSSSSASSDEKRPRTAFSSEQLAQLRKEFEDNRYLNEDRRKKLANELGLNETQIKIWFQNKRAKLKKTTGGKGDLAKMLAAQGLYNHATVGVDEDEFM